MLVNRTLLFISAAWFLLAAGITPDDYALARRQDAGAAAASSSQPLPSSSAAPASDPSGGSTAPASTTATSSDAVSSAAASSTPPPSSIPSTLLTSATLPQPSETISSSVYPSATNGETTVLDLLPSPCSYDTGTTAHPEPQLPVEPQITPAFGIAGVIMIVSGVAYTVIGVKNKWYADDDDA